MVGRRRKPGLAVLPEGGARRLPGLRSTSSPRDHRNDKGSPSAGGQFPSTCCRLPSAFAFSRPGGLKEFSPFGRFRYG